MPEGRGSSFRDAAPPVETPTPARSAPQWEDAPTQIKPADQLIPVSAHAPDTRDVSREWLGATLDHFEILDCIGVGGMGRVFRARDNRLDRMVALKVLAPELSQEREVARRFEQEAKAAARLDDLHFPRVYFYGEARGLPYIAMEFVEGINLRQMILDRGRIDYSDVVNIGLQIVRGLAHAAACGVVHRDIKPSNIIVTPTGLAKLVDMGLARNFFQTSSPASELTHAGITLGTFDYISPEQARDPREADVRSDIYSLGCTLYHALTGRPPFPEGTALQKLLQHQSDVVPDPRRFAPELPDELVAILMKMLAKDPRDRYQSPVELTQDLTALCQVLDIPLPDDWSAAADLAPSQPFWERQLIWLAPSVLFLAAMGLYLFFDRREELPPPPDAPGPLLASRAPTSELSSPAAVAVQSKAEKPTTSSTPPPGQRKLRFIGSGMDLRREIEQAGPGDELVLQDRKYLVRPSGRAAEPAGLLLDKELTIRAAGAEPVALEMESTDGSAPAALLVIQGAKASLAGLQFLVRSPPDAPRGGSAIEVRGGELALTDCAFSIAGGARSAPGAAVEVLPGEGATTSKVRADRCYFSGSDGFRLSEQRATNLELVDCAFDQCRRVLVAAGAELDARLANLSVFVGDGPVFQFGELAPGLRMHVAESVFSRLRGTQAQPLIQVRLDTRPGDIWWQGEHNLYHGFENSILTVADKQREGTFQDLEASDWGIEEDSPLVLPQLDWPWHLDDPRNIVDPAEMARVKLNPAAVFRLASGSGALTRGRDGQPIGVRRGPWGRIYGVESKVPASPTTASDLANAARPAETSARSKVAVGEDDPFPDEAQGPGVLVVDPKIAAGAEKGVFRTLNSACDDAAANRTSTIELRTNDVVPIRDLKIAGKELTIRATNGFRPRLTLAPAAAGRLEPARLFQLTGGARLRLVGVAIDVEAAPLEPDAGPAVVFDCDERSAIELRSLWILLGRKNRAPSAHLAMVRSSANPAGMPGMPTTGGAVKIDVQRCEIRSRASLVSGDPRAHWKFSALESLLACEEPLIDVRGAGASLADSSPSQFECKRSTVLLRDGLVSVSVAGDRPDPARRIEVLAEQSVFIGCGPSAPFARAAGGEASAQMDAVRWEGEGNFIAGYAVLFQHGGGAAAQLVSMAAEPWLRHCGLSDENYFVGTSDLPEYRAASFWELPAPTIAQLRRMRLPAERGENLGAPLQQLTDRAPLSTVNF